MADANNQNEKELEPLKLQISPHLVQDLGLNLYTSLPKVLVEFVANAHDADSPDVRIWFDHAAVSEARRVVKAEWTAAKTQHEAQEAKTVADALMRGEIHEATPFEGNLKEAVLPENVSITIEDRGIGMSRDHLKDRFLIAGRRRREEDLVNGGRTEQGRLVMGRKGLGKLAGFGVAQIVEVISRARGEDVATKITLDYAEISKHKHIHEIVLPEESVTDPNVLPNGGTRITLRKLLYEPVKSEMETIQKELAEHFYFVGTSDFKIYINDSELESTDYSKFVYAWPLPETPIDQLVEHLITPDEGKPYKIQYRMRFLENKRALPAQRRGVRIYSHGRLAAAPSLLEADTNMHGFRMTDYLDGVAYCDAIDDQAIDLIATDRQGIRWETPMLAPLKDFLSEQIKTACKERQRVRDLENLDQARRSPIISNLIEEKSLSKAEGKTFEKIAASLAGLYKMGFDDPEYEPQIENMANAYMQGNLFSELRKLSVTENPDFADVVAKIMKLTSQELDGFYKFCRGRLAGIEALQKIVDSVDFRDKKNEDQLHTLLKSCPWLIDPTYFEFLTSNQSEASVIKGLEKALNVAEHVTQNYDPTTEDETEPFQSNKRPDLVFLLGNAALKRIIIVELKAPNTPLHSDHFTQLRLYMMKAEAWLRDRPSLATIPVHGYLIGSFAKQDSVAEKVKLLRYEMSQLGPDSKIQVLGVDEMLTQTRDAHKELLQVVARVEAENASQNME